MSENWGYEMPKFENVLSLGNVIQLAAFLVMFAAAWGSTHQRLNVIEDEQRSLQAGDMDREVRLRAMEVAASKADERVSNILQSLGELKAQQRETNELLRSLVGGATK